MAKFSGCPTQTPGNILMSRIFCQSGKAFYITPPTRRALAGMLAVFAEFKPEIVRERVKVGIV